MKRLLSAVSTSALALAVSTAGCNPAVSPPAKSATLTAVATPRSIVADGTATTTIALSATAADDSAGTGDVTLTVPTGSLNGAAKSLAVTLENGRGSATFSCDVAVEAACTGSIPITAAWADKTAVVSVTLTTSTGGGTTGGGTTGGGTPTPPTGTPAMVGWSSTTCDGQPCPVMGIDDSGFHEVALVSFLVTGTDGQIAAGAPVAFTLNHPPAGTAFATTGTTAAVTVTSDADGVATVAVKSGASIGAFSVHAQLTGTGLAIGADSPTIGVRGAKPSNHGLTFYCDAARLPAFLSFWGANPLSVDCHVRLVDRFNNPVGTGTPVYFKTEAGSIANAVATVAYDPSSDNADEGTATVSFSTLGKFPPDDVGPLAANAVQYPFALAAEPVRVDGPLTRNPRDALVTVIAYVQGEEYFSDDNANGKRDAGETFVNQGEPFVDSNDDGAWNPGEIYLDVFPANGAYDGPNAAQDANTTIWADTRLLYTGSYSEFSIQGPFGDCASGQSAAPASTASLLVTVSDRYLNAPANAISAEVSKSESPGSIGISLATSDVERFGFDVQRQLLNAAGDGACATGGECRWGTRFGAWSGGDHYELTLEGGATAAPSCVESTGKFVATTNSVSTTFTFPLSFL